MIEHVRQHDDRAAEIVLRDVLQDRRVVDHRVGIAGEHELLAHEHRGDIAMSDRVMIGCEMQFAEYQVGVEGEVTLDAAF